MKSKDLRPPRGINTGSRIMDIDSVGVPLHDMNVEYRTNYGKDIIDW